ncbi:Presenilin-domain-containing protein [Piromyces finnis]|uniref:Presenilin n=1 Tax=Piromyces finnis TaxID=1754191 RepID=A0A1Y1VI05_9FUNG|nr:Presenilin-domain-containing protein [Piromyces finnis]|eukprot:ORX56650.1 Presenilin-domain-containing protein [Piromyces finnis]
MSQLTNSSNQFKIDKETGNDNVFINIYNTNKESEIISPSTTVNVKSNNVTSHSSIDISTSSEVLSTPNNNNNNNNNNSNNINIIENPFESPPTSSDSSPVLLRNNINTSIPNINNSFINNHQNQDKTINIDIFNSNENPINNNLDINHNTSINEATNPQESKQFNVNKEESKENLNTNNSISVNTSILENNIKNEKSFSSKKTVKTAITFDLNKKKRVEKNYIENERSEKKKDKEKVSEYCPVCKAKASYMCSSCGPVIFYCSQSCQIAHWPEHRLVCKGVKKHRSYVERKKTESIFGEIIDPTIGSDGIVGTRNVAQLINLKRSRTDNVKSKTNSVLSGRKNSTARLIDNAIEEEDESEEENNYTDNEIEVNDSNASIPNTSNNNDKSKDENHDNSLTGIKTENDFINKNKLKNSDENIVNSFSIPTSPISSDIVENNNIVENPVKQDVSNNSKKNNKKRGSYRKRTSMIISKAQEDEELIEDLKFYIKQIFLIIKPVLLCILLTIIWVKLSNTKNMRVEIKPGYVAVRGDYFKDDSVAVDGNSFVTTIFLNFKDAISFIFQMIAVTVVVAILFIFSCVKTLTSLYIVLMLGLLSIFSYITLQRIVMIYNIPIDIFSTALIIWNVVVVGLVVIFWKGPLSIQQYYLVFVSSLMALSLSQFSEWTTWIILTLLAVWDLIAVLCPFGPLRLLLKHSEENQQEIPALLYTLMVWIMATPASPKIKNKEDSASQNVNNTTLAIESSNKEELVKENPSKQKSIETSFTTEVLSVFNIKNVTSPPISPVQQSSNSLSVSNRNSNISNNGGNNLTITTKHQSSRPLSVSSVSSGSFTLTRKKNPTLKRYPSNGSSVSGVRNRPSSPNGSSVVLTNRPPSVNHSNIRSFFSGSISDENASTAILFQDNSNSYSYDSLKRGLSRNSSIDSQFYKKRIDKKYKYPNSNSESSRKYGHSERRLNRNLSHGSQHYYPHYYNHRSPYASHHSTDNESSVLSDDTSSDLYTREASFSSIALLVNNRSQTGSFNDNSGHHNHQHSHSHHHRSHHHHSHHHHNDHGSLSVNSQTSSITSVVDRSHSHRHSSRYSSIGHTSDFFGRFSDDDYRKKKRKREKRLRKEKERRERQRREDEEEEAERNGIKLGLGDFVFYSVLVAKAASQDWMTTINCTIAVITGLTITIFLLAVLKKALPALPISIAFGLIFYFTSKHLIGVLMDNAMYVSYFSMDRTQLYHLYKECIDELRLLFQDQMIASRLDIGKKYMGYFHF